MVRAIIEHGAIKPLDPLPEDWADGVELRIERTYDDSALALQRWAKELTSSNSGVTMDDFEALQQALEEDDREQKSLMKRRMEAE